MTPEITKQQMESRKRVAQLELEIAEVISQTDNLFYSEVVLALTNQLQKLANFIVRLDVHGDEIEEEYKESLSTHDAETD